MKFFIINIFVAALL